MPIVWLVLVIVLIWQIEPFSFFSDEITVYQATCSNDVKIMPFSVEYRRLNDFDKAFQAKKTAEKTCQIQTWPTTTYRIDRPRAELVYLSGSQPKKLVNCVIYDRENLTCDYPDRAQGVYINRLSNGKVRTPEQ